MYLLLQTAEFDEKNVQFLALDSDQHLHFRAIALDEKGKELYEKLSKFRVGEVVDVIAETDSGHFEGYYKIVKLEKELPEADAFYRFHGELEQIM